jgi:hypothetical protein
MTWFDPVDNYCERLDSSFWAEPLNALSNLAFIVAGLILLRQWRKSDARDVIGLLLVINVLVIGVGSFLFHTFANRWSALADVLPITVFIHGYLAVALRHYLGFKWWQAVAATAIFFAASPLLGAVIVNVLGSSAFYVPALLAIFAVAAAAGNRQVATSLRNAGIVFAISIAFRALDMPMCEGLPQGTHLLWHLLNGIVLFLLVRTCLKTTAAPAAR